MGGSCGSSGLRYTPGAGPVLRDARVTEDTLDRKRERAVLENRVSQVGLQLATTAGCCRAQCEAAQHAVWSYCPPHLPSPWRLSLSILRPTVFHSPDITTTEPITW